MKDCEVQSRSCETASGKDTMRLPTECDDRRWREEPASQCDMVSSKGTSSLCSERVVCRGSGGEKALAGLATSLRTAKMQAQVDGKKMASSPARCSWKSNEDDEKVCVGRSWFQQKPTHAAHRGRSQKVPAIRATSLHLACEPRLGSPCLSGAAKCAGRLFISAHCFWCFLSGYATVWLWWHVVVLFRLQ